MADIVLEVCVDSLAGLAAAIRGGADRIELCAALGVGGLTPSAGMMQAASVAPVPVYAMIRPRPGDFVYSDEDLQAMRVDIDLARDMGMTGVVFGGWVKCPAGRGWLRGAPLRHCRPPRHSRAGGNPGVCVG